MPICHTDHALIVSTDSILRPALRQRNRYRIQCGAQYLDIEPARQQDHQQGLFAVGWPGGFVLFGYFEVSFALLDRDRQHIRAYESLTV